jgi:hypothetical protein
VADADTMAEAVNGVFEDTTGGIMVVSLIYITAVQETELSNAFLDLLRQAGEQDSEWQATKDAVLRKDENVVEELKLRTTSYTTGDTHAPALKLRIQSQKYDSKAEKPAQGSEASRMLRTAIEDRRKPQGSQRHRECLRSLSRIARSPRRPRHRGCLRSPSRMPEIAIEDRRKPRRGQ